MRNLDWIERYIYDCCNATILTNPLFAVLSILKIEIERKCITSRWKKSCELFRHLPRPLIPSQWQDMKVPVREPSSCQLALAFSFHQSY